MGLQNFVFQMMEKEFGVWSMVLLSFGQDGWKTRDEAFCGLPLQFLHGGGPLGMLFRSPSDFSSMHVPQHFTGIWALGKLRRQGKSLIILELPIGYDCYRGFQNFSKEATKRHLSSLRSVVVIKSRIRSLMEDSSGFSRFSLLDCCINWY